MASTRTNTNEQQTTFMARLSDEPWGIWAAIAFYIATIVTSVLTFGVAGLTVVAVPGAIFMLIMLLLIVRGK